VREKLLAQGAWIRGHAECDYSSALHSLLADKNVTTSLHGLSADKNVTTSLHGLSADKNVTTSLHGILSRRAYIPHVITREHVFAADWTGHSAA
jgi:hypothetical protein